MRNSTIVDGIVEEWSDTQAVLKTIDGQNLLIIQRPTEDIMVVKIALESPRPSQSQTEKIKEKIIRKSKTEQIFEQKVAEPSNPYDLSRNKSLAELKVDLAKQEKEIITSKLKEHYLGDVRKVEYGYPRISKKPGTE
jgi:hypothetical protein